MSHVLVISWGRGPICVVCSPRHILSLKIHNRGLMMSQAIHIQPHLLLNCRNLLRFGFLHDRGTLRLVVHRGLLLLLLLHRCKRLQQVR